MKAEVKQQYIKLLKSMLSAKRLEHSICVSEQAVRLAKKHGADPEKAELAGLLHDITKDTPAEKQLKIISDSGIILNNVELSAKRFWHSISGAVFLQKELGIEDPDVLNAVRYHTTGRKNMSLLEKVVFEADDTSKDRNYPGVESKRKLVMKNLDKTMLITLSYTISDLAKNGDPIVADTLDAYNDAVWTVRHSSRKE